MNLTDRRKSEFRPTASTQWPEMVIGCTSRESHIETNCALRIEIWIGTLSVARELLVASTFSVNCEWDVILCYLHESLRSETLVDRYQNILCYLTTPIVMVFVHQGPVHMGSQVPSPTHVSKSQHGGKVPIIKY